MSEEAEGAVRRYFDYLDDPSTIVNEDEIRSLKDQVDNARSLMERAKALSELERAESADDSAVVRGFITHGRKWAAEHGVTGKALRKVGVPADVLEAAGISVPGRRGRRPSRPTDGPRRSNVSSDVVREDILGRSGRFTYKDVIATTNASLMTVRKVIDSLQKNGDVKFLGYDSEYRGRGRAPNVYERP